CPFTCSQTTRGACGATHTNRRARRGRSARATSTSTAETPASMVDDPFDEARVAAPLLDTAERHRERPALADEDAETLCARDRRIEERARQHVRVRRRPRRDDRRELRSLRPVH